MEHDEQGESAEIRARAVADARGDAALAPDDDERWQACGRADRDEPGDAAVVATSLKNRGRGEPRRHERSRWDRASQGELAELLKANETCKPASIAPLPTENYGLYGCMR